MLSHYEREEARKMAGWCLIWLFGAAMIGLAAVITAGAKYKGHHVMDPWSCYAIAAASGAAALFFVRGFAVNLKKARY